MVQQGIADQVQYIEVILLKTVFLLIFLLLVAWLSPSGAVDPWGFFIPKKIALLIFALAIIQVLAEILIATLGAKIGTIMAGFLGGLISSTALTATLARQSKQHESTDPTVHGLIFLGGSLGMLVEAFAMTVLGIDVFHPELLFIFLGPFLFTLTMIAYRSRKKINYSPQIDKNFRLDIASILKITAFIVLVLALSKMLQNFFGESGLLILTFLVSLFEVHGSVIANVQLHDAGVLNLNILGSLLAISIAASYVSKLFLSFALGGTAFKKRILKFTSFILFSLAIGWTFFELTI